jgi:cupin 2 domain-containing protein
MTNIFSGIPHVLPNEITEVLCQAGELRIERIVSQGHSSPPGFWYDQDEHEFVLLIKGRACLTVEGNSGQVVLEEGDWLEIKAHVRHRVEWTAPDQDTVWLAVYYRSNS